MAWVLGDVSPSRFPPTKLLARSCDPAAGEQTSIKLPDKASELLPLSEKKAAQAAETVKSKAG